MSIPWNLGQIHFLELGWKRSWRIIVSITCQVEQFIQHPRVRWFRSLLILMRNRKMETTGGGTCDLCGYSTSQASKLRRHKMIHTGEKPYQCVSCEYSFTTASNLKSHSYTHTGEKPYQCGSCDFSCTTAGDLKTHSYTHTGEKPYQCTICDYSSAQAGTLKKHSSTHIEKKP